MALTEAELVVYLRRPGLSEADPAIVQLVALANGLVLDVTGPLLAPEPARVQAIRLEVAARAYRNPSGLTGETVGIYTWRGDPTNGRSGVYLTESERAELLPTPAALAGPWSGSMPYCR